MLARGFSQGVKCSWGLVPKRPFSAIASESQIEEIKAKLCGLGSGSIDVNIPTDKRKIAIITIKNPHKKNALSGKMMCDFHSVVSELQKWKEGAGVILTGEGDFFCAGADLSIAKSLESLDAGGDSATGLDMSILMQQSTTQLRRMPLISVASIEGGAVGGGAELMTTCDHRVMSTDAYVQFVHTKMSLTTGWGGATRLTNIVGRREALRLLCAGQPCELEEAREIHLIDEVATPGNALDTSLDLLQSYTMDHDVHVTRAMKEIIANADSTTINNSLDLEREIFARLWRAPANESKINSAKS